MLGFTLIASLSYVIPAFGIADFVGAEFVDLVGNTVSLILMVLFAKMRKPTTDKVYMMNPEEGFTVEKKEQPAQSTEGVNAFLAKFSSQFVIFFGEDGATVNLAWIGNGGVMIFIAGIIGGLIQGASFGTIGRVFVKTCKSMWKAIVTIIFIIAVAKVNRRDRTGWRRRKDHGADSKILCSVWRNCVCTIVPVRSYALIQLNKKRLAAWKQQVFF